MLQPVIRPTARHCDKGKFASPFNTICRFTYSHAIISLAPSGKSVVLVCASRTHERGATRSSRVLGAGCDGRVDVAGRAASMRPAKSCGPDPPTLGSSLAVSIRRATVATKPGHRGEHV